MKLYKKYEELLQTAGETSYQVSKATGIAQSTLADWKSGRSQPKVDKLQKIADHFDVPVSYFLEDTTGAVHKTGQKEGE
jgi:repressor LexA